jgi:hypothetical protein
VHTWHTQQDEFIPLRIHPQGYLLLPALQGIRKPPRIVQYQRLPQKDLILSVPGIKGKILKFPKFHPLDQGLQEQAALQFLCFRLPHQSLQLFIAHLHCSLKMKADLVTHAVHVDIPYCPDGLGTSPAHQ